MLLLLVMLQSFSGIAVAEPAVGKFLKLQSPINEAVTISVRNEVVALQDAARQSGQQAILILQVPSGQSEFHHVYGLTDFLTSGEMGDVTTVAWITSSVTGHNALIALGCNEIVMTPDATLGDIGQGVALSADRQAVIATLIRRQRNLHVNASLAQALMDPAVELLQLTTLSADGVRERSVATLQEAERLRAEGVIVEESVLLKERGTVGSFSGARAKQGGFLIRESIATAEELLQLYELPLSLQDTKALDASPVDARLIEVRGGIDTVHASFVKRQIERAVTEGTT